MSQFFQIALSVLCLSMLTNCANAVELPGNDLPDKSGATIKGVVACGGRGIANVVISDGFNVTKTDAEGRYWLKTKINRSDFIMMTTPSGYDPATRNNFLPVFYHEIDKNASSKSVQRFDFQLTESPNDDHVMIVVADEHVSGRVLDLPPGSGQNFIAKVDSLQFRDDFMPKLVDYTHSLPAGTKIYGLNLGDMTHSEYWFRNNTGMNEYLSVARTTPFQMYHAIGNHDHCHKDTDDYTSEAEYRKHFGPTYYSFNIGKVHYVVLDDMLYKGKNSYDRIINYDQLSWLNKDLKALDPSIKQLVIGMHVPVAYNNSDWTGYNKHLSNWDEFFVLLDGYDVKILTGDWHTENTTVINERIVEYSHAAITGNWWYVQGVSNHGGPAGFTEYRFSGDRFTGRQLVDWSNNNNCSQYTVYNKGITSGTGIAASAKDDPDGEPAIIVNFWSIAPNWSFVCKENGNMTYGRGTVEKLYDPQARELNDKGLIPSDRYRWLQQKPARMFRYVPRDPNAEIEIIATDNLHHKEIRVKTRIEKKQ